MHNRFFCTSVKLFFCLGLAQPSGIEISVIKIYLLLV